MDLRRLVQWLVVLGLLAFAWSEGRPWLERHLRRTGGEAAAPAEAGGTGTPEARRCVELAREAAGAYGDAVGRFARGRDEEGWSRWSGQLHGRVESAWAPCGCAESPCRLATEALRELDAVLAETDLLVGGDPGARIDPGRDLEGVYALLDRARDEL